MSTVSAVVLTYNKAWIVRECLASLRCQSRQADEVIVVDDASTDDTRSELANLPASWLRLTQRKNRGQSRARNIGFRYATGDYLVFIDGDVVMESDMLESMARALDSNPAASIAYSHYLRQGTRRDAVQAAPWDAALLRRRNYVSAISLVRRLHLPQPPFDETLRRYEDWDAWLRMSRAGRSGVLIDRALFTAHYRAADLSGQGESPEWYRRVVAKHGDSAR